MSPSDNGVVALLAKIKPSEVEGSQYELEKLKVNLTWKPDAEKIARMEKLQAASASNNPAVGLPVTGGVTDPQEYQGGGGSAAATGFEAGVPDYGADTFADEKNCNACTMLNPVSATICSICGTSF